MKSENNLRMQLKEALDNLWARIKSLVSGLDTRVTALEQGGGGGGQVNVIEAISFNGTNVPPDASKRVSLQEADPTVPSWAKASSKPTYTASEVGALADTTTFVSGVKGNAESTYRSGQVNLTPANVGALALSGGTVTGAVIRKVDADFDTPPSSTEWNQVIPVTDDANDIRGGVYLIRNTDGSYQTIFGARNPSNTTWIYIAPKVDANGNPTYDVSHASELKAAIGLGNVNNGLVLTTSDNTLAKIYAKLNAMPITPDGGAGVPCWISAAAMNLLTGGKTTSTELHGIITKTSSTGYRIFGMYGATGYMMYWSVTVTSSAITPNTVYKLQGTAM